MIYWARNFIINDARRQNHATDILEQCLELLEKRLCLMQLREQLLLRLELFTVHTAASYPEV